MNPAEFVKYIDNPTYFQSSPNTVELRELCLKYPFFQSAHILLLLAQNQEDSIFTGDHLAKTAIYAGDRGQLYQRINEKQAQVPVDETQSEIPVSGAYDIETTFTDKKPKAINVNQDKKLLTNQIIDKFLQEKPSIQKPKAEFYSAPKKAAESLDDSTGFATETLAKIYIRQKNYVKALKIYQQLSLQNPEKSNYFAPLIESLKNKLNE